MAPNVQTLNSLYYQMIRYRLIEEKIALEYPKGFMRCPVHLSVGQEAIAAAWSLIVRGEDIAVSSHRPHLHFLAKGGSLTGLFGELLGKDSGCSRGRGGSMHLADRKIGFLGSSAIVGNSIPVGVGAALASSLLNQEQVTYIFLGDGATEEGAFYESVNFAAVRELPVVFVVENNKYSVYSNFEYRQAQRRNLVNMANSMGISAVSEDGNDAVKSLETFLVAHDSAIRERQPFLLEFETFRLLEHCGPHRDDHLGYRPKEELEHWLSRDPIENLERKFPTLRDGRLEVEQAVDKEIEKSYKVAMASDNPYPEDLAEEVYA